MANNLDALNPEYWSKRMQVIRHKESVYMAVGNMEERALLKNGDTVHRPYRSKPRVQTYTRGTDVTPNDQTTTDETLVVNTAKIAPFYIDDLDELQNNYKVVNDFADDAGRFLEEFIDGDFLGEVVNADHTVDAGDVGGTAGTSLVVSTSNVLKVFAAAGKKLDKANVKRKDRYAVITPTMLQTIVEYLAGKDTSVSDDVGMNGFVGKFMGFELYLSNSAYWTARWTPADNPSNGATITIAGVTFTFVSSIGSTAGNILIGGSTAATLDNLVAAINDPTTTSANQVALADEDVQTLEGIVATDGTTYLGLAFEGGGEVAVTTSVAADAWSLETVWLMFGKKGAVDIVVQQEPKVEFKDHPYRLGQNVFPWCLYGLKTFDEGDAALVAVKCDSSSW